MKPVRCSECGTEVPNSAWACPHCNHPLTEDPAAQGISPKGMWMLLLLFVAFPVILFLLHIFVPGL